MKFGKGFISMWAAHYIRLYNLKVGFEREIKMIEWKTCKNKAFENALGTDDGWENCHKPITNIFVGQKILSEIKNGNFRVVFDEPETCDQCFGRQKAVFCEVTIDSIVYQALQCRDCGIRSYRPVLFGVVMSTHEKFLEE